MKLVDNIEKLIRHSRILDVNTSKEMDQRIMEDSLKAQKKVKETKSAKTQPDMWRTIIMKRPITKIAAAAAVILIAVLGINLLEKSATPAWAIEQTIQASHSVRYIHLKSFWTSHEEPMEGWVEFDVTGNIRNVRMHLPAWFSPYDGDIELV